VTLQLFYRVHIVGFLILVIFANMHFNRVWLWVFPGAQGCCIGRCMLCMVTSNAVTLAMYL
jgi:hypothetical protein